MDLALRRSPGLTVPRVPRLSEIREDGPEDVRRSWRAMSTVWVPEPVEVDVKYPDYIRRLSAAALRLLRVFGR